MYRNELIEFVNKAHQKLKDKSPEKKENDQVEQMFSLFEPGKDLFKEYSIKDLEEFSQNIIKVLNDTLNSKKRQLNDKQSIFNE